MDPRIDFARRVIKDKNSRILEIGPLNRPIVTKEEYPNSFSCDIRSTEEVKRLYSGNDYLEVTGIRVDSDTIVDIDFIIKGNYSQTFEGVDKFDYVIASHVMEHMEDLIFALNDISTILKPGGIFIIVYPDKRYCFDHFRESSTFVDAYCVNKYGNKETARRVFDFFFSVVDENNPALFWNGERIEDILPKQPVEDAYRFFEDVLSGKQLDDVHYWPFSDKGFLKFLYDCVRAGMLPFHCVDFQATEQNDQQFMLALQYESSVMENPNEEMETLSGWMQKSLPDYYTSDSIRRQQKFHENENKISGYIGLLAELTASNEEKNGQIIKLTASNEEKTEQIMELTASNEEKTERIAELTASNEEKIRQLAEQILEIVRLRSIEKSTIWRASAPLRKVLDCIKCVGKDKQENPKRG